MAHAPNELRLGKSALELRAGLDELACRSKKLTFLSSQLPDQVQTSNNRVTAVANVQRTELFFPKNCFLKIRSDNQNYRSLVRHPSGNLILLC